MDSSFVRFPSSEKAFQFLDNITNGYVPPENTEDSFELELDIPAPDIMSGIRAERDRLLSISDWTMVPDAPLTKTEQAKWKEYRQALRDLPSSITSPETVVWPIRPDMS